MYQLWWKGEMVDECDTYREATYLLNEYNSAYRGGVTIKER